MHLDCSPLKHLQTFQEKEAKIIHESLSRREHTALWYRARASAESTYLLYCQHFFFFLFLCLYRTHEYTRYLQRVENLLAKYSNTFIIFKHTRMYIWELEICIETSLNSTQWQRQNDTNYLHGNYYQYY